MEIIVQKYELEQDGKTYSITTQVTNGKLRIICEETNAEYPLAYFAEFTLTDLVQLSSAFASISNISEAVDIFTNNPAEISERVYARIISDELMGQIFARIYVLPNEDPSTFAMELTKEYYPGYSEAVYERRADNIVKWCRRIIEKINTKYL